MPDVGDRVLARWPAEIDWWYPGVVCERADDRLLVQFDDGDRAWVTPHEALPLDLDDGARVYGRWQGGGQYHPGLVTSRVGDALHIRYDDGDEEWTSVSMVRVHRGMRFSVN